MCVGGCVCIGTISAQKLFPAIEIFLEILFKEIKRKKGIAPFRGKIHARYIQKDTASPCNAVLSYSNSNPLFIFCNSGLQV